MTREQVRTKVGEMLQDLTKGWLDTGRNWWIQEVLVGDERVQLVLYRGEKYWLIRVEDWNLYFVGEAVDRILTKILYEK